jgi:uncharacterized membrane protein YraQ (UPF0718 family)
MATDCYMPGIIYKGTKGQGSLKEKLKKLGVTRQNILVLIFIIAVIFWVGFLNGGGLETSVEKAGRALTLTLWAILLEALPFVLLGSLISGLIQVFVTEDMLLRLLPKNKVLQLVSAALVGLIFPICECAIIPITRGLIKKGMPTGAAIAFMTATPIINPIVLLSTYNAFPTMPLMTLWRFLFGFAGAVIIGFIVNRFADPQVLKETAPLPACSCGHDHDHEHDHACNHDEHDHDQEHEHNAEAKKDRFASIKAVLAHTGDELKSVGAYLIFGALIAAALQLLVPKGVIAGVGGGRVSSTLAMMLLAFVMSLCSEADAFVASTFLASFPAASVLGFLITGPMIDIKNTMMLMGSFKKRFALRLIITILLVCFTLAMAASFFVGGGK